MPLDGARAEKEPRTDLRVRQPLAGESRDLLLLRRQLISRVGRSLAGLHAGGRQLAAGALGEGLHPRLAEHPVRRTQLLARFQPPTLPAQPFSVEEVRSRVFAGHTRAAEAFDRVTVEGLRHLGRAQERLAPRLEAESPL